MGGFNIRRKTIFYDIDVLATFLRVKRCDLLKSNFSRIVISNINYKKLNSPSSPQFLKDDLNCLISEFFVKVEEIHIPSDTFDVYCLLMNHFNDKAISKAEASSFALAIKNNGLIACNDFNIFMPCIERYDLDYTTSAEILLKSYKKGLISKEETKDLWDLMYFKNSPISKEKFLEMLEEI